MHHRLHNAAQAASQAFIDVVAASTIKEAVEKATIRVKLIKSTKTHIRELLQTKPPGYRDSVQAQITQLTELLRAGDNEDGGQSALESGSSPETELDSESAEALLGWLDALEDQAKKVKETLQEQARPGIVQKYYYRDIDRLVLLWIIIDTS